MGVGKSFYSNCWSASFRTFFAIVVVILAVQRLRMLVQFQNGFVWTQTLPHTDTHTHPSTRIPRKGERDGKGLESFLNMHEHLFELVAEQTHMAHT